MRIFSALFTSHSSLFYTFIWLFSAFIITLFFLGIAASQAIPFGPPMSVAEALRQADLANFLNSDSFPLFLFFALFLVLSPLLVYTYNHPSCIRPFVALFSLVIPLFVMGGIWGIFISLGAPIFTYWVWAGLADGEFYAEGFLAYTAVGWWNLLWIILLSREYFLAEKKTKTAKQASVSDSVEPCDNQV